MRGNYGKYTIKCGNLPLYLKVKYMYDCIIIGTGAAGVSAALTLKALNKNFIIIGNGQLSAKIRAAEKIKNYPGLPCVSGDEMGEIFQKQLKDAEISITDGKVTGVYPSEDGCFVQCGSESYEAKTVILATGVEVIKPVKGEAEFLGRGVSYCAVCDGFLYKGKKIAVFLEGSEELSDLQLLTQYAATIHLFTHKKDIEFNAPNVVRESGAISEIVGGMRVDGVISGGKKIEVDGVFMLKSAVAADSLVHGLKTEGGSVTVDRQGRTNLARVFAAGDCTGRPYQYAKAVGEGNVCAYSVNDYLNALKK